jgi:hypothetical protein
VLHVGYEKIGSEHYRQHLVERDAQQTLCGFGVDRLAHLSSFLSPGSFLAIGSDAEPCRRCAAEADKSVAVGIGATERYGQTMRVDEQNHWADIMQRLAAEDRHLLDDR